MGLLEGVKRIRDLKIQGATSIALYGLDLYAREVSSFKTGSFHARMLKVKNLIEGARPDEPMLFNILELFHQSIQGLSLEDARRHVALEKELFTKKFEEDFRKIAVNGSKLIRSGDTVFTHCHSSSVIEILGEARKTKDFTVVCSETRPRFQGRLTAKDLLKLGISARMVLDSRIFPEVGESSRVLLGADVLLGKGVINKVGSLTVAFAAKIFRKPLHVCSHSLKYYPKVLAIEKRSPKEVWADAPKSLVIDNPAFELVPWNLVTSIVSERGVGVYGKLF